MMRLAWRTIMLIGLLFPSVAGGADDAYIESVRIRGTRRPLVVETRAGQKLDLDRVERDVRRLWATGWFDDISVESSDSRQGVRLTFKVVERPRLYLRRVKFEPTSERRPLRVEKGKPVDAVMVKRIAGQLQGQLVEEGHPEALVRAELVPAGFQQVDLRLRVEPGRLDRVETVRFSGLLGLEAKELRNALRATRSRRLLPGLGPMWRGWRLLAPFSDQRLQADLERLRSLYFARGFFDASVKVGSVEVKNGKATVTIEVDSGRQYRVAQVKVAESRGIRAIRSREGGAMPTQELCDCFLRERRSSEKGGALDFSAWLQLKPMGRPLAAAPSEEPPGVKPPSRYPPAQPWIELSAEIGAGPTYRVGRIEFRGNRAVSDLTLRRTLLLHEGDVFDQARWRSSLVRLRQLRFIEPIGESDVRAETEQSVRLVNLTIQVREKRRGLWMLSGPFAPVSAFGPFQYTIGSRLPALGNGPLELSTYYASFSLLGWPSLLTGSSLPVIRWRPLVAVERPYLPGQDLQSGLVLSPQLKWGTMATLYGLIHGTRTVFGTRGGDSLAPSGISVPVSWLFGERDDRSNVPTAGALLCEERRPSWARVREIGTLISEAAANWLLMTRRL